MDQKLQLLKTVPLFAELNDRAIGIVGQLTEEVDVKAGHVLMRQGDQGDAFYVLVDGSARIERDGKLLKTVGPGSYFGEIALLDHGVRTATVTTDAPSRLIVLGHREFEALLDQYDDIRGQIWECVGRRIRTLEPEAVN
ncbi:MAG TPA: cyclic nucleotide-binding domain-containing protein [Candidatus Limnocylindrales bacterium]|nr:cyclic nucleotide-binding domain-containing protein [Candidatus Limnocylindrales bacterium]